MQGPGAEPSKNIFQKTSTKKFQEFLKEEPNDSFLIYALSLEYVKENNIDLAIETLLELHQKNVAYLAVYYQLG